MLWQYYRSSVLFTVFGIIAGFYVGGPAVAFTVMVLGILETSLSFDNAVVNASILKNWDEVWRRRFLTWGMLIAVFGMRLVFPLLIVGVVASLGPVDVVSLALNDPLEYSATLMSVHHEIAAYGGVFLLMVFLKFFIDHEKDVHWVGAVERPLAAVGKVESVQASIAAIVLVILSAYLPSDKQLEFIVAGIWGLVTYIIVQSLGTLLGGGGDDKIIKAGVGGFIYLEVLDASFSFDGVIGAFALSTNIFVIAIGLGIGAMFVRSMTIHLVNSGKLAELKFLEHSAFWGIGALAVLMLVGSIAHVPEVITGLLSASFIVAGVGHSMIINRREKLAVA